MARERKVPLIMRVPVPWVFMLTYLTGLGVQLLVPLSVHSADVRLALRIAGYVLVVVGTLIAFSSLWIFRRKETTTIPFDTPSSLVTVGAYRFTRNPMYVGLTLIYVGVAGTRGDVWPFVTLLPLLAYVNNIVIPVEEKRLLEVFGDSYQQYRERVRRWA